MFITDVGDIYDRSYNSAVWDGIMDAVSQMSHTMSYGLLLFGLGLCVTLLYLMFY